MSGPLYGKWPAVVDSYDGPARQCRVRIPGVTDGSNVMPLAAIEYPIGDRATAANSKDHTEIRILAGDPVWVEFECGDPRFPIITGYRVPREGSPVDWRRWRHANIEITADGEMVLNATNLTLNISGNVTEHIGGNRTADLGGNETATVGGDHATTVTGSMASQAASSTHQAGTHAITAAVSISGSFAASGGAFSHEGKNVGATHKHSGVASGSSNTGNPV